MSANPVQDILIHHLVAEGRTDGDLALQVLAASEGEQGLALLLDDGVEPSVKREATPAASSADVPRTYLSEVHVRAFRGIGPDARLPLRGGPGVTLVIGRNGSGKSSFAEGVEVAFTGTCARWKSKGNKEWQEGWKSVHAVKPPRLVVHLTQEGDGPSTVERTWADPETLGSGSSVLRKADGTSVTLEQAGWTAALANYRPFLSYSELGGMLDEGPSRIYQALLAGLGLDELEKVRERLARGASQRKKLGEDVKKQAGVLATRAKALAASHVDEPRFAEVARLLEAKQIDLDTLAPLVALPPEDEQGALVTDLMRLVDPVPTEAVSLWPGELRALDAEYRAAQASSEGRSDQLASLLKAAIELVDPDMPEPCPVCYSVPLDRVWLTQARAHLATIEATTSHLREVGARVRARRQELVALFGLTPVAVRNGAKAGWVEAVAAATALERWSVGRALDQLGALADHLETVGPQVRAAIEALRQAAAKQAARRDEVWRPFATGVEQWIVQARHAREAKVTQRQLEDARDWVAVVIDTERVARIEPIKTQAIGFWNTISTHSNVRLHDIVLSGQGKAQRVTLDVTVDDVAAPALGVMSQGELNAMTLSLFLPRILMDRTPFGFVIVDDPVQAMDSARVDGLAAVLSDVGRHRQVVVFTHDTRLQEAFLRLGLPHVPLEVERARASEVSIRNGNGPIEQRLSDATAIIRAGALPEGLPGQVVPMFCRQALEAACMEPLRRRWLSRGDAHAAVESRFSSARLRTLLAMVFYDAADRADEVPGRLKNMGILGAAEIVADCQAGTHEGFSGDLPEMVKRTRKLCDLLRKMERVP